MKSLTLLLLLLMWCACFHRAVHGARLKGTKVASGKTTKARGVSPPTGRTNLDRVGANDGGTVPIAKGVEAAGAKPSSFKSNKDDSPTKSSKALAAFAKCFDECGLDTSLDTSTQIALDDLRHGGAAPNNEKPSCCKGGVSAFMVTFQGLNDTRLIMPYALDEDLDVNDPCPNDSKGERLQRAAVFADCRKCFPTAQGIGQACDPSADVDDTVVVNNGDSVCVMSFDAPSHRFLETKLPTNLLMYHQNPHSVSGTTSVTLSTLHTSCSEPIYPPYSVRLGTCRDDPNHIVTSSIASQQHAGTYFVFEDAMSAKWPGSLLTGCDTNASDDAGDDTDDESECCDGGATFLRLRLSGAEASGFLSLDPADVDGISPCLGQDAVRTGQQHAVRFVPCDDDGVDLSFSNLGAGIACATSYDTMHVADGDEICLGSWDDERNRLDLHQKMPTDLPLYFVPASSGSNVRVRVANIHTSCSHPLHVGFAQPMVDPCTATVEQPVVEEDPSKYDGPRLSFLDGVSRSWANAALEVGVNASIYDVSFAGCGCECNRNDTIMPSDMPTVVPAQPSQVPSRSLSGGPSMIPSNDPSVVPSIRPSEAPTRGPSRLPSQAPTQAPSRTPSYHPSRTPSQAPSRDPSQVPTWDPSQAPSRNPSQEPSQSPSSPPSRAPSREPSQDPSSPPSFTPTEARATEQPGPLQPPTSNCSSGCDMWVLDNCIVRDDFLEAGLPCNGTAQFTPIVGSDGGDALEDLDFGIRHRKLFHQLKTSVFLDDDAVHGMNIQEKAQYHVVMATMYTDLLNLIG